MLNTMKTIDFIKTRTPFILGAIAALVTILILLIFTMKPDSKSAAYSVKTFETGNGWGYSVLLNNREIIHQDLIPAISSQASFATKADALKTAGFVVEKLREQKLPYLTKDDLKALKIHLPEL